MAGLLPLGIFFPKAVLFAFEVTPLNMPEVVKEGALPIYVASTGVGMIDGGFSVGVSGSAGYKVGIESPPGIGGMNPEIYLTYDSQRGNGALGVGWALDGIPAITRCPKTKRTYGNFNMSIITADDGYCYNSEMLVNTQGYYGYPGAVYSTARKDWSKIVSYGTCGGDILSGSKGPCYFVVTTKDGNTIEIGNTEDSRFLGQGRCDGAVLAWSANKITDLNGNFVTLTYNNNTVPTGTAINGICLPKGIYVAGGGFTVKGIQYTGNAKTNFLPQRFVSFAYENRPDQIIQYTAGSENSVYNRLSAIQTYVGSSLVMNYKFSYETAPSSGVSRLIKIDQCDPNNVCMKPTTFAWQNTTAGFSSDSIGTLPGNNPYVYQIVDADHSVQMVGVIADLNGDGIPDFTKGTMTKTGQNDTGIYLGTGNGTFESTPAFYLPEGKYVYYLTETTMWPNSVRQLSLQGGFLGDLNGDGIADFTQALRKADSTIDSEIWLGTGTGFVKAGTLPNNGYIYEYVAPSYPEYFNPNIYQVGLLQDINGDGVADYTKPLAPDPNNPSNGVDLSIYLGFPNGTFQNASAFSLPSPMFFQRTIYHTNNDGVPIGNNMFVGPVGFLQDLNNDNIPDFTLGAKFSPSFFNESYSSKSVHLGTGTGFYTNSANVLPDYISNLSCVRDSYTNPTGCFSFPYNLYRDMNGDRIFDFAYASCFGFVGGGCGCGSLNLAVYLGASDGSYRTQSPFSLPDAIYFVRINHDGIVASFEGAILEDLNGDGVLDYTRATKCSADNKYYNDIYLGTGANFAATNPDAFVKVGTIPGINPFVFWVAVDTGNVNFINREGLLQDLNGDGLCDFSKATKWWSDGSHDLGVYLGNPNGTFQIKPAFQLPDAMFYIFWDATSTSGILQDLNGDGILDFNKATNTPSGVADGTFLGTTKQNFILNITNGFDGHINITYSTLMDPAVYVRGPKLQTPLVEMRGLNVVKSYVIDDGRGNQYPANYTYQGSQFDQMYREWQGFNQTSIYSPAANRSVIMMFNQTYPYFNLAMKTQTIMGQGFTGLVLAQTSTNYSDVGNLDFRPQIYLPVPVEQQTDYFNINGSYLYSMKLSYNYTTQQNPGLGGDVYNNVAWVHDWGNVQDDSDDIYTYNYYYNDPDHWRFGYPRAQRVTANPVSNPFPTYPSSTPFPSSWNVTQDLSWVNLTYTPTMQLQSGFVWDNQNNAWTGETSLYDIFGHKTTVCQIDDGVCTAFNPNATQYFYEATYQTFVSSILMPQNIGGVRMQAKFDTEPRFGRVYLFTDYNNNQFSAQIDYFGNPIYSYKPHPTTGVQTLVSQALMLQADKVFYMEGRVRQSWDDGNVNNWPFSQTYVDGMGRAYLSKSTAATLTQIRAQQTLFDKVGRVYAGSLPYFEGEIPQYSYVFYDNMDRPVSTVAPDGTISNTTYNFDCFASVPSPLKACVTSAFGTPYAQTTTASMNTRGSIVEKNLPNLYNVSYVYDKFQRVLQTIDPTNLKTNMTYDSLGRLIARVEPDVGLLTNKYNLRGNVYSATDAKNQTLLITYDKLDRPITKTYLNAYGQVVDVVNLVYDGTSYPNGFGRLFSITNTNTDVNNIYSYTFAYDFEGNVKSSSVILALINTGYTFTFAYDPQDRVINKFYPDSFQSRYTYNLDGSMKLVQFVRPDGFVTAVANYNNYNALGQFGNIMRGQTVFGQPALNKTYVYSNPLDSTYVVGALKNAITVNAAHSTLFNLNYVWDKLKNLQNLNDTNPSSAFGQVFSYDATHMNYLTSALGTRTNELYTYDPVGSVTQKDSTKILYKPQSHQITLANSGTTLINWGFDSLGNLESKVINNDLWQYQFDVKGQLVMISKNIEPQVRYYYNAVGSRIGKIDSDNNITAYISGDYTVVRFARGKTQKVIDLGGYVFAYSMPSEKKGSSAKETVNTNRKKYKKPESGKGN